MPGWHEATEQLLAEGKIRTVGIIQEQHPDRCRLFMQWKQMDWPILVDSQNLLDVSVVPLTILIDERGIVRRTAKRGDPRSMVRGLIEGKFDLVPPGRTPARPDLASLAEAASKGGAIEKRTYGEALMLRGGSGRLDEAIDAFQAAVETDPADGRAHFRLGVAYRARYDSDAGSPEDFSKAVEHWGLALASDPNQYIWRRRIEQYGPRLDKPYPFYDWVETARSEIEARGEIPSPLIVEPVGAELTGPSREFDTETAGIEEPDSEGRIHRDNGLLISVSGQPVPAKIEPGKAARIHLEFRPNPDKQGHWNNESRGLVVWVDPPTGWDIDRRRIELDNPPSATSDEARRVEFEVRSSAESAGEATLRGYALYYVCEGAKGQCLYRRQDLSVDLPIDGS